MPVELLTMVRNYVADTFCSFGFRSLRAGDSSGIAPTADPHHQDTGNGSGEANRHAMDQSSSSLQVLLEFRAAVRSVARAGIDDGTGNVSAGQLFQLCDTLRDSVLPQLAQTQLTADLATAQVSTCERMTM